MERANFGMIECRKGACCDRRRRRRRRFLRSRRGHWHDTTRKGVNGWNCTDEEAAEARASARLKVLQLNAGSLAQSQTFDVFRSRILQHQPDIVVVQEDWLTTENSKRYKVDGYQWYHVSRKTRRQVSKKQKLTEPRGGGLSILVKRQSRVGSCKELVVDLGPDVVAASFEYGISIGDFTGTLPCC